MKCSRCAHVNVAEARFCAQCGQPLVPGAVPPAAPQPPLPYTQAPPPQYSYPPAPGPAYPTPPPGWTSDMHYAPAPVGFTVPSHMAGAVLVTIFCCLPLGIVAIIKASSVSGHLARGDIVSARRASESANSWCWAAAIFGVLFSIFMIAVSRA